MKYLIILLAIMSSCNTVRIYTFDEADFPYKYSQDAFKCDSVSDRYYFSDFQGTHIFKAHIKEWLPKYAYGDTLIVDNDLETFWNLKQIK